MRPIVLAAPLAALLTLPVQARASDPGVEGHCTLEAGPDDRVAQDRDLVIPAGARVKQAVVMRGNLVVERGARVEQAVAAGGSLTVKAGAQVAGDAVAVGGDLRVEEDVVIGGNAVALGGQVKLAPGSTVKGDVTGLAVQLGPADLRRAIAEATAKAGPCRVVDKGAR